MRHDDFVRAKLGCSTVTGAEFARCREIMGCSTVVLAKRLDVPERLVRRWERDGATIPPRIAEWMTRIAALLAENPPPSKTTDPA